MTPDVKQLSPERLLKEFSEDSEASTEFGSEVKAELLRRLELGKSPVFGPIDEEKQAQFRELMAEPEPSSPSAAHQLVREYDQLDEELKNPHTITLRRVELLARQCAINRTLRESIMAAVASDDELFCDECEEPLQRESCNHVRACVPCRNKAIAECGPPAEELARRIAEGIHAQMRVEDRIYYDPERFAAIALASLSANTGQTCPKCGNRLCQPYKSTETGLWTQRCDRCEYFDSWAGEP